jgi:hypothetical protein
VCGFHDREIQAMLDDIGRHRGAPVDGPCPMETFRATEAS